MIRTRHLLVSTISIFVAGLLTLLFVGVRGTSTIPSEREEIIFAHTQDVYGVTPATVSSIESKRNAFIEKVRDAIARDGVPPPAAEFAESDVPTPEVVATEEPEPVPPYVPPAPEPVFTAPPASVATSTEEASASSTIAE